MKNKKSGRLVQNSKPQQQQTRAADGTDGIKPAYILGDVAEDEKLELDALKKRLRPGQDIVPLHTCQRYQFSQAQP